MAKELARIKPRSLANAGDETNANRALLEFQSPTLTLISRPVPGFSHYATYMIASMVVVFLVIAGTMPIERVVTAVGRVTSRSSNILVQPLDQSIVRSIDVQVGQRVKAGDLLARLDPTLTTADLASMKAQTAALQAQVARMTAEQNGLPYVSDGSNDGNFQAAIFAQRHSELTFKIENYRQKIASLEVAVKKAQEDAARYSERVGFAQALLKSREDLERQGVGSRLNTLSARDSLADIQRLLAEAKSAAVGGQRDMEAMVAERDGFIHQWQNDLSQQLSDARPKLADIRGQMTKAQKHSDLVEMRADQDATVLGIASVSVGSVLNPADPFITLVPDDAVMEVNAAISASEVGFVRVGDAAVIKFDAYPMHQHGYAEGTVVTIAPDAQDNPGAQSGGSRGSSGAASGASAFGQAGSTIAPSSPGVGNVPVDLGATVYQVKISIDTLKMTDVPSDFRLRPGLGLQADIQDGKRTILSYLFSRYVPMLTEGMREP